MQKILSRVRCAVQKYDMIKSGDKIAVGVSGGKDSLVLLIALCELQRFYPEKYELIAVIIDMQFENMPTNYDEIEKICNKYNIKSVIKRTGLYNVIFNNRKEKNPCSLCANMRRGILHNIAKEQGCNKIALGHHLDDAVETMLMNLFRCGRAESFRPVTYLSRKDLYMIRPLVLTEESDIIRITEKQNLPVIESKCIMDKTSEREKTKQ